MKTYEQLVELKKRQGYLSGQDAADVLKYIRANEDRWTADTWDALTAFQLGRPTGLIQFKVIAGKPIEPLSTSQSRPSATVLMKMNKRIKQAKAALLRYQKPPSGDLDNTGVSGGVLRRLAISALPQL